MSTASSRTRTRPAAGGRDPRPTDDTSPGGSTQVLALLALASAAAAIVHAAVVPEHSEWWPSTTFFVGIALFQLGWAVLLVLRPTRPTLLLGAAVNAGAVALWLLSRSIGMPFGPHGGVAEPFARTDVLATVLEVVIVAGALWLALRHAVQRSHRPAPHAFASALTGAAISAVAVIAVSAAPGHSHLPGESAGGHQHGPAPNIAPAASTTVLPPPAAPAPAAAPAVSEPAGKTTKAAKGKAKKAKADGGKATGKKAKTVAPSAPAPAPPAPAPAAPAAPAPASVPPPQVPAPAPAAADGHTGHSH